MSIPSSSEAVATSARNSPRFRRLSASSPLLAREAAMVGGHVLIADAF